MTERGAKEGGYFHGRFYDNSFLSEEQNIGVRIVRCKHWPLTRQKRIILK